MTDREEEADRWASVRWGNAMNATERANAILLSASCARPGGQRDAPRVRSACPGEEQ
jgi:hypothetical protein